MTGAGTCSARKCVEDGHRLLLCSSCGERALPLEEEGPTNVKERHQARQDTAYVAYGWSDVLRYCFLMVILPYLLFTGAHAMGTMFRRNRRVVEKLYARDAASV